MGVTVHFVQIQKCIYDTDDSHMYDCQKHFCVSSEKVLGTIGKIKKRQQTETLDLYFIHCSFNFHHYIITLQLKTQTKQQSQTKKVIEKSEYAFLLSAEDETGRRQHPQKLDKAAVKKSLVTPLSNSFYNIITYKRRSTSKQNTDDIMLVYICMVYTVNTKKQSWNTIQLQLQFYSKHDTALFQRWQAQKHAIFS